MRTYLNHSGHRSLSELTEPCPFSSPSQGIKEERKKLATETSKLEALKAEVEEAKSKLEAAQKELEVSRACVRWRGLHACVAAPHLAALLW